MKRVFFRIAEIYREEGLISVPLRALRKCGRLIFHTNSAFWLERDLTLPIPVVKPRIPVEINLFAREESIAWFRAQKESWIYNPREIEVALRGNHIFPNIKYKGEIVGYVKAGKDEVYLEDYRKVIRLPKNVGFCYDYFIAPAFRGKNLSLYMNVEVMHFARRLGIKKIVVHMPPWNTPSIKVSQRLGFRKFKYVRHFRILGIIKFEACLWREKSDAKSQKTAAAQ
jgi:RimJ/RimL family protein N-acetyltransferase